MKVREIMSRDVQVARATPGTVRIELTRLLQTHEPGEQRVHATASTASDVVRFAAPGHLDLTTSEPDVRADDEEREELRMDGHDERPRHHLRQR